MQVQCSFLTGRATGLWHNLANETEEVFAISLKARLTFASIFSLSLAWIKDTSFSVRLGWGVSSNHHASWHLNVACGEQFGITQHVYHIYVLFFLCGAPRNILVIGNKFSMRRSKWTNISPANFMSKWVFPLANFSTQPSNYNVYKILSSCSQIILN